MWKPSLEKTVLPLYLLMFLALGIYYALATPFCKPDEGLHYAYVLHLKAGKGLPVIRTEPARAGFSPVEMEGHQPPAYYGTVALVATIFNLQERVPVSTNPYLLGTLEGNRSPWTPVYSTFADTPIFFTGRFVSLISGVAGLAFAYLLLRMFVPPSVALLGILFMGLNPQYLFISTSFSNDIPVAAVVHAGLWQLGKAMREDLTFRRSILLGIIIALATLIKLTGLGLLIPLGLLALWQSWKARHIRPLLWAGVSILVVVLIDGWWFWRNWTLYGDPFATNLLPVLLGPRSTPFTWKDMQFLMSFLWKAYWLDFSPGGILFAEPPVYTVLGVFCIVGIVGLIQALARHKHLRPLFLLLWGWFFIVLVGLIRLTSQTSILMGGGRLLFPAAITAGATLAVGLTEIFRRPIVPGILAVLLGIYSAIAPAHYLSPVYPRPTLTRHLEIPPTYQLGAIFGDGQFELIGYSLELAEISGHPALSITFYWRTLKETAQNFSVFIHLETWEKGHPEILTQLDTYPGYGVYPTSAWREGWIFVDRLSLPLPLAGQPFSGNVVTGLYFLPTMERLPAYDRMGRRYADDSILLARVQRDKFGTFHLFVLNCHAPTHRSVKGAH